MRLNIKNVELDIRNAKERTDSNDKFVVIMEPYINDSKSKFETVDCMYKKMMDAFKELSEFYCIDSKTSIGELFSDIKTFCAQFRVIFVQK